MPTQFDRSEKVEKQISEIHRELERLTTIYPERDPSLQKAWHARVRRLLRRQHLLEQQGGLENDDNISNP